jgi:hypothetical protein
VGALAAQHARYSTIMTNQYHIVINALQRAYFIDKLPDGSILKAMLSHLPQDTSYKLTISDTERLELKATVQEATVCNAWLDAQNITDEFERQDILWMHDMLQTAAESGDEYSALHPEPTINGLCL